MEIFFARSTYIIRSMVYLAAIAFPAFLAVREARVSCAQTSNSSSSHDLIFNKLTVRWSRSLPLRLLCSATTEFDKKVRARMEEAFHADNPGSVSPFGPLKISHLREWIHDGKRFLARERTTFPDILARRRPSIDGKWHRQYMWDGERCIGMETQGNREVPIIASVLPADSKHLSSQLAVAAQPGADLLLCASDGRSWPEFLKGRKVQIGSQTSEGVTMITVSWEEQWGERVVRTLYVQPSRSHVIARQVDRRADGEQIREVDVAFKTLGEDFVPWRARHVTYAAEQYFGKNVPQYTTDIAVDQIEVLQQAPNDAFAFDPQRLPQGSEVLDLGRMSATYVGAEVTDSDILQLVRAVRQYLKDARDVDQLYRILPRKKNIAYPYHCGPHSLLALCELNGVKASTPELAKLAETDDKGITTFAGMIKALNSKGLPAKAFEVELQNLKGSCPSRS